MTGVTQTGAFCPSPGRLAGGREGRGAGAGSGGAQPSAGRGIPPTILQSLPRILIVRTGSTAIEVQRRHGDYDRWFRDALVEHDLAFDLCDATRTAIPDPTTHAGILVTGSVKSVVHPEPWMEGLKHFLRRAEQRDVPLLAVCFGCQALAWARGGTVVRSPAGWEIGAVEVTLTQAARLDPLFEGLPQPLPALATHEDRVERMPADAVLLAGNPATPVQAFRVGEKIWGVQFHPEATTGIVRELILLRRDRLEAGARAQGEPAEGHVERLLQRLQSFDPAPMRRLLSNFVRLCVPARDAGRTM